jgi:pimeloyl-ACP methyl ester carboxylesterase
MWILIMVLLVVLVNSSPVRAWTVRRKISFEQVQAVIPIKHDQPAWPGVARDAALDGTAAVRVLLIHGTFSSNATWTAPGSAFLAKVAERLAPCVIERLLWSGDNSSGERVKAAHRAAKWIAEQAAERIYIIGHSHGGYIAALAASMADDPRVRVITMSTPFFNIVAQPIHTAVNKIDGLDDSCRFLLVLGWIMLMLVIPVTFSAMGVDRRGAIFFVLPALSLVYPVICILFWKRIRTRLNTLFRYLNSCARKLSEVSRITLSAEQMTVCRAAGDEASGVLAVSQVACWILLGIQKMAAAANRYIRRLEFLISNSIMQSIPGMISVVALIGMAICFHTDPLAKFILMPLIAVGFFCLFRLFSIIVEVLLALPVWVLSFVVNLPFGAELAVRSWIISISVEATPVGRWTSLLVNNINSSLAHSALYEQEEIFDEIARMHRTWQRRGIVQPV